VAGDRAIIEPLGKVVGLGLRAQTGSDAVVAASNIRTRRRRPKPDRDHDQQQRPVRLGGEGLSAVEPEGRVRAERDRGGDDQQPDQAERGNPWPSIRSGRDRRRGGGRGGQYQ